LGSFLAEGDDDGRSRRESSVWLPQLYDIPHLFLDRFEGVVDELKMGNLIVYWRKPRLNLILRHQP
jgi:hypothetical protein